MMMNINDNHENNKKKEFHKKNKRPECEREQELFFFWNPI